MSSSAFAIHLTQLLQDADELIDTHTLLSGIASLPQAKLDAVNRSVVVTSVSAWETYIEELACESVLAMQPPAGSPLGTWSVHYASILGHARRFHTPDPKSVKTIISDADVRLGWVWAGSNSAQSTQELLNVIELRHRIAHGKNPRPLVASKYANSLTEFFRRLAQATDQTVRHHLVNVLAVASPWPP